MPEPEPRRFSWKRLLPLLLLLLAGASFVALGGHRQLRPEALAANRDWLSGWVLHGGAGASLCFMLVYAGLVALSVPGAWIFTLTSGFLFGPWLGTGYAVVGATIGATIVFIAARAGLAGLAARAGPRIQRIEAGFREDALSYLLVLRLVPIFPFWLVNLAAGATGMRLSTYVAATFLGMIPATFVFASLGSGLGTVLAEGQQPSIQVLLRPGVLLPLLGLALLVLIPVAYRKWRGWEAKTPVKAHAKAQK